MTKSWRTKLIHTDASVPEGYRSLTTAVRRGSTTLFHSAAAATDQWDQYKVGYTYGLYGTPTTLELAARICELEKGKYTVLARFGVTATFYQPDIGDGIADLIRENTRLVWTESPQSITMQVQDIPAIAAASHARGVQVVLDNTWSAGILFDAFEHGVDITMQALTKYVGGHSDLLLGSVTVRDEDLYQKIGAAQQVLGGNVSPDDASLALRGLQTLAVRLSAIEDSALKIAQWLAGRVEVERVRHPALASCPGHQFWKRDFLGSSGLFSIVLRKGYTREQVVAFVDNLKLFKIGYSWAGVTSLALAYDFGSSPERPPYDHRIVRLNIGLESTEDLIADLEQSLEALPKLT